MIFKPLKTACLSSIYNCQFLLTIKYNSQMIHLANMTDVENIASNFKRNNNLTQRSNDKCSSI